MLPRMTTGNWIFWGIMAWIGVNLLWLGLIEKFVPQYVGAVIATIVAFVLIKFGPRPYEDEEEEE